MTKTESAHLTAQTVLIESAEQVLQLEMAAGVRLAIPNTNNLIMVGPAEWIAKNVPGVEAMVEGAEPAPSTTLLQIAEWLDSSSNQQQTGVDTFDYASQFDYELAHAASDIRAAVTRLAATTQASTAQAEQSRPTDLSKRLRAAATAEVSYADARLLIGAAEEIERYYGGMMAWKRSAEAKGADAQAAAEVRDAALEEAAAICDSNITECCWTAEHCAEDIRALRAGDTGEQADGGAACS